MQKGPIWSLFAMIFFFLHDRMDKIDIYMASPCQFSHYLRFLQLRKKNVESFRSMKPILLEIFFDFFLVAV